MRLFYLLMVSIFFCMLQTRAQKRKTFKINPGEKVTDVISWEDKFTYPDFIAGTVYLRNETYFPAPLNYNSLYGEMQFIDSRGDTLSLADESTIKWIVIKTDTFYYNKGYLKLVKDYGEIKLAMKQFFSFVNRQKIGGFGEISSASIDTYNTVSGSSYFKGLITKDMVTIAKNTVYYIGDSFNNFKELNKKNLLELYAKRETTVQAYLRQHKIDFTDESEIRKMLDAIDSNSTQ